MWTRCGPNEPTTLADGGLAYPADHLTLTTSRSGEFWTLYTNQLTTNSEHLAEVSSLRFAVADERVVTRATIYGTGNIQVWAVVDVFRGDLRRWSEPPLDGVFAPLLGPGERVGKQYEQGIEVKAGALELTWLVYRQGEPNCCPTGGVVKVRLSAGEGQLRVARAWREAVR